MRSKVKCFSITRAPNATAAIGTSIPNVWSEYPTSTSKVVPIVCIAFRLTSTIGVGYSVLQCNIVILSIFLSLNTLKASSISEMEHIPVDITKWGQSIKWLLPPNHTIPLCKSANDSKYGKFVISPDGIFIISGLYSSISLILSKSKAVANMSIDLSKQ